MVNPREPTGMCEMRRRAPHHASRSHCEWKSGMHMDARCRRYTSRSKVYALQRRSACLKVPHRPPCPRPQALHAYPYASSWSCVWLTCVHACVAHSTRAGHCSGHGHARVLRELPRCRTSVSPLLLAASSAVVSFSCPYQPFPPPLCAWSPAPPCPARLGGAPLTRCAHALGHHSAA